MDSYQDEPHFPPKAGVYAVRAGPVISKNVVSYIKGDDLDKYVPQREFLALLMTGDGKAIGTKYGISFTGKWVWNMKDMIDVGFMKLFYANHLFKDYDTQGTAEPLPSNDLYDQDQKENKIVSEDAAARVSEMSPEEAIKFLNVDEEYEKYWE